MRMKKTKYIIFALSGLVILCAVLSAVVKDDSGREKKLKAALEPFLKEEEPASGGTLPASPRFVLYDMDSKEVYIPDAKRYSKGTDDPDQVNVVVAYDQVFNSGRFYAQTEKGRQTVYSRDLRVSVIQLDGWKLIAKNIFPENGGSVEKKLLVLKNHLISDADQFVNSVLDGIPDPGISVPDRPQPAAADAP